MDKFLQFSNLFLFFFLFFLLFIYFLSFFFLLFFFYFFVSSAQQSLTARQNGPSLEGPLDPLSTPMLLRLEEL